MKSTICVIAFSLFSCQLFAADYEGKSNAELARELANPNTPLTSLKFKTQYRTYTGDLDSASEQSGTRVIFQPTLPFPMASDNTLYVRPALPLLISSPTLNSNDLGSPFSSETGFGDITIDLQYGDTEASGFLWSYGATTTMPTATEDKLGADKWTLGPGFQLGKVSKSYVAGGFFNHQWSVAGSGEQDISLSTLQLFGVYLPGGGWSVATSPIMTYDHEEGGATIPVNFAVGKTVKLNGRPWKFAVEVNYYVEQADPFGPDWMIGVNVAPVVKNMLAEWL
ncbi:transporter [Shewanella sp. UCD-KL12]|uniref:transporter n=1 Tax=Shewanella sp. UCD-KL12 TaxID=1917163 RepID=UPI0009702242|nr:transporter [Shewanella sp. UCD-KL12]